MPRTCTICLHPEKPAINAALVAGEPYRVIAQRFAASADAVYRHKVEHLPVALVKATEAAQIADADTLALKLHMLTVDAQRIRDKAEAAGDLRTALVGNRELVRIVELMAKLAGELQQEGTTNIYITPQWIDVRTRLMHALHDFPEARAAVALVLREGIHEPA